jgi:hypothetical protein
MSPHEGTPDTSFVHTSRNAARTLLVALVSASLTLGMTEAALAAKPAPTISVQDASVTEVDAGATNTMSFRISASGPKGSISVNYATANGTATAGQDYVATSGTANLPNNGCRCVDVPVTIQGDDLYEGTETFSMNLSNASGGTISRGQAVGTITDNETPPTLSVADETVGEADGTADLEVTLSAASGATVTVAYATADGAAVVGQDYVAKSGTLSFSPGQTSKTVSVTIVSDVYDEADEDFSLNLSSSVNATLTDGTAVVTILDDDEMPAIWIDDVGVTEGDEGTTAATFTVTSQYTPPGGLPVDYAVVDETASAGDDYVAHSGTLVIPFGETTATVSVDVFGDPDYEPNETFSVVLSNPIGAALADDTGTGTILNDDVAPTTLTAKASKRKSSVKAKGVLEVAESGLSVKVTLQRTKGSRWVKVATKTVGVKDVRDRDEDLWTDASFAASFPRPARGSYRFVVKFAGAPGYLACSKTVQFKL